MRLSPFPACMGHPRSGSDRFDEHQRFPFVANMDDGCCSESVRLDAAIGAGEGQRRSRPSSSRLCKSPLFSQRSRPLAVLLGGTGRCSTPPVCSIQGSIVAPRSLTHSLGRDGTGRTGRTRQAGCHCFLLLATHLSAIRTASPATQRPQRPLVASVGPLAEVSSVLHTRQHFVSGSQTGRLVDDPFSGGCNRDYR